MNIENLAALLRNVLIICVVASCVALPTEDTALPADSDDTGIPIGLGRFRQELRCYGPGLERHKVVLRFYTKNEPEGRRIDVDISLQLMEDPVDYCSMQQYDSAVCEGAIDFVTKRNSIDGWLDVQDRPRLADGAAWLSIAVSPDIDIRIPSTFVEYFPDLKCVKPLDGRSVRCACDRLPRYKAECTKHYAFPLIVMHGICTLICMRFGAYYIPCADGILAPQYLFGAPEAVPFLADLSGVMCAPCASGISIATVQELAREQAYIMCDIIHESGDSFGNDEGLLTYRDRCALVLYAIGVKGDGDAALTKLESLQHELALSIRGATTKEKVIDQIRALLLRVGTMIKSLKKAGAINLVCDVESDSD